MILEYSFTTEINKKVVCHTVYTDTIEKAVSKWINQLEQGSLSEEVILCIKSQYERNKVELAQTNYISYLKYMLGDVYQLTYISSKNRGQLDFIADLTFLTTEEGGRKGHVLSGYRAQIQFEEGGESTSSEQLFVNKDKVYAGDSVSAELRILRHDVFKGVLYEGQEFKLKEADKVIAKGKINQVINQELRKH